MQLQQIVRVARPGVAIAACCVQRQMADAAQTPDVPRLGAAPANAIRVGVDGRHDAADQLEAARRSCAQMELRLKPEHPDMIRARSA